VDLWVVVSVVENTEFHEFPSEPSAEQQTYAKTHEQLRGPLPRLTIHVLRYTVTTFPSLPVTFLQRRILRPYLTLSYFETLAQPFIYGTEKNFMIQFFAIMIERLLKFFLH
jgi:hypothetical protein